MSKQERVPASVRRARIEAARAAGKTWPEIADTEGVSVTRCQQIARGEKDAPINPDGELRTYHCNACRQDFELTTRWKPKRCPLCGSNRWPKAVGAALLALALFSGTARAQDLRPNVLVFVLDDATPELVTPSLAAVAAQGMRFTATSPSPLCAPARASILTGKHTHNHGVKGNLGGAAAWEANGNGQTVADWFHAAGYATVRAGKWINDVPRDGQLGWSYAVDPVHSEGDPGGTRYLTARVKEIAVAEEAPLFVYFAPVHDWTNPAPEYAGSYADEPFAFLPSFNEADVSDKRWDILPLMDQPTIDGIVERRRKSLEVMETMVDALAAIRSALSSRPTYVVITSDHGHEDGQHRHPTGKGEHFEESIRTPLFVLGPGIAPGESSALVYPMDLAPTVAELAGVPAPAVDARSLVPLLEEPTAPWRLRVLLEHGFVGVRTAGRKLAIKGTKRELYNLTNDPFELRNRCDVDDPTCGAALEAFLPAMRACVGASCWEAETVIEAP